MEFITDGHQHDGYILNIKTDLAELTDGRTVSLIALNREHNQIGKGTITKTVVKNEEQVDPMIIPIGSKFLMANIRPVSIIVRLNKTVQRKNCTYINKRPSETLYQFLKHVLAQFECPFPNYLHRKAGRASKLSPHIQDCHETPASKAAKSAATAYLVKTEHSKQTKEEEATSSKSLTS